MCGILGTNYKVKNFKKGLSLLNNRGPDFQDVKEVNNVLLGHTRLAIIDLNNEANQPMEFDKIVLVFNGEIYNYKELIKNENLKVKTKSDSEVIIRLYQKYGFEFLDKLNGMFAFSIYDKNKDLFFCARDRFGKKPFFYYYEGDEFIFGSEIKSILKILNYTPNINYEAFMQYLRFSAPLFDNTIYKDIKKLPAGYYLIFNGKLKIKQWYDIPSNNIKLSKKETFKKIEDLLTDSIKLRLNSDVEVATFLSGGVDSSLVSAIYSKFKKINTFSIGYDEYLHYSETDYAKKVAKHIDSNHHELIISKQEYLENLDNVLSAVDEPFGDSATIPTLILSKFISNKGIKVALSGEGSDELFLGYDNYFKMVEFYKMELNSLEKFNLTKEWEYKRRKLNNEDIFYSSGETFTDLQLKNLLNNYTKVKLPYNYESDFYTKLSYYDFKYWIENILMTKIDRASMANSLEVRAPFLDYRLVEFMFSLDFNLKKGDTNKYLLKQIALKYLPEEIVFRRKKGFSSPFIEWLFDEYKD